MSTPSSQPPSGSSEQPAWEIDSGRSAAEPAGGAAAPGARGKRHRPWGWIAACVVLLLVAGGFAVWAFGLQSDLDSQEDQTARAEQEAQQANEQAQKASDAVGALSAEVDDINQAVSDAGDQLSQSGQDARERSQEALDGLRSSLATLRDQLAQAAEDAGEPQASPTP